MSKSSCQCQQIGKKFLLTWTPDSFTVMTEMVQLENWRGSESDLPLRGLRAGLTDPPLPNLSPTERPFLSACPAGNIPAPGSRISKRQANAPGVADQARLKGLPILSRRIGQHAIMVRALPSKASAWRRRAFTIAVMPVDTGVCDSRNPTYTAGSSAQQVRQRACCAQAQFSLIPAEG